MVVKMYSIYDVKTQIYQVPFPAHNDGDAVRRMSDEVNLKDSQISRHPEDFLLYCVGQFDDNNGRLKEIDPQQIIAFSELRKEK